jgi:hypothetical protein
VESTRLHRADELTQLPSTLNAFSFTEGNPNRITSGTGSVCGVEVAHGVCRECWRLATQ